MWSSAEAGLGGDSFHLLTGQPVGELAGGGETVSKMTHSPSLRSVLAIDREPGQVCQPRASASLHVGLSTGHLASKLHGVWIPREYLRG